MNKLYGERSRISSKKKKKKYISNIISETAHNYFFMVDFEKLGGSLM